MAFPCLKLRPAGAREGQMVQTRTTLVERLRALQVWELMNTDERPSHKPHDVVESTRVLIDNRIGAEQLLVPGLASAEVTHCQRDVRDRRKLGHQWPPCYEMCRRIAGLTLTGAGGAFSTQPVLLRYCSGPSLWAVRALQLGA